MRHKAPVTLSGSIFSSNSIDRIFSFRYIMSAVSFGPSFRYIMSTVSFGLNFICCVVCNFIVHSFCEEEASADRNPGKWNWINTFIWLIIHERILTNFSRFRRHMGDSPLCLRGEAEESVIHLLRDCRCLAGFWPHV